MKTVLGELRHSDRAAGLVPINAHRTADRLKDRHSSRDADLWGTYLVNGRILCTSRPPSQGANITSRYADDVPKTQLQ